MEIAASLGSGHLPRMILNLDPLCPIAALLRGPQWKRQRGDTCSQNPQPSTSISLPNLSAQARSGEGTPREDLTRLIEAGDGQSRGSPHREDGGPPGQTRDLNGRQPRNTLSRVLSVGVISTSAPRNGSPQGEARSTCQEGQGEGLPKRDTSRRKRTDDVEESSCSSDEKEDHQEKTVPPREKQKHQKNRIS